MIFARKSHCGAKITLRRQCDFRRRVEIHTARLKITLRGLKSIGYWLVCWLFCWLLVVFTGYFTGYWLVSLVTLLVTGWFYWLLCWLLVGFAGHWLVLLVVAGNQDLNLIASIPLIPCNRNQNNFVNCVSFMIFLQLKPNPNQTKSNRNQSAPNHTRTESKSKAAHPANRSAGKPVS